MPITVRTRRVILVTSALVAFLLVGGFAFVSFFMHAVYEKDQTLYEVDVPTAVRENFQKRFPDATEVGWEFEEGLYEAEFHRTGNEKVEAHFGPDGTWAKTVVSTTLSNLPTKAQLYLKSQNGYNAVEPERIERPGSLPSYEAKLASKLMEWNCLFDADGNLISRTRDGPVLE